MQTTKDLGLLKEITVKERVKVNKGNNYSRKKID